MLGYLYQRSGDALTHRKVPLQVPEIQHEGWHIPKNLEVAAGEWSIIER